MRRFLAPAACGLLLLGVAWAAPQPEQARQSTLVDALYGYSLTPPKFPNAQRNRAATPLIFSAPAQNGFASNVYVSVQATAISRDEYRKLSLEQLKQGGMTVIADKDINVSGRDAVWLEYEGTVQNRDLHSLAVAVIDKDRVLLVTATALKEAYKEAEPALRECLQSFRVD